MLVARVECPRSDLEIGYHLAREHQGKGLATEAAQRWVRYAFAPFPMERIVAMITPGNGPSLRLASRLSMQPAGEVGRGGRRHIVFAVTRDES